MDFNLITNAEQCHILIKETVPSVLVYYSHIPTMIISLLVGMFVYLKNKSLVGGILLGLSVTFSLWLFFSLIAWVGNYNTVFTMFTWSLLGILDSLFFILSLYFVYVFIDKKDVSLGIKTILGMLLLPVIVLTPTIFNLSGFTLETCEAIENTLFVDYLFYVEIIISAWILILTVVRYWKATREFRRQILLLVTGISFFLLSFFLTGLLADYFGDFKYELYGTYGMTVFLGFLGYLIVKFNAFNIKFVGAQVLVIAQIVLISSMFFFATALTSRILISVTLF